MHEKCFSNYKLISHEHNNDTVLFFLDGLKNCSGRYIKLISPGDELIGNTIL